MTIPPQLSEMAQKVKARQHAETTVRVLLSWFGSYRRSWRNVKRIRDALAEVGLVTMPDFEGEYIDGIVMFRPKEAESSSSSNSATSSLVTNAAAGDGTADLKATVDVILSPAARLADPAHRISRLPSANLPLVSVAPDATVALAITLMLRHDYSQLPVMQSPDAREVKGMVTWKSLGARLAAGKSCTHVRDCMEPHKEILSDASLFDAIGIIAQHDAVLVRAPDKKYSGIVTAYDIGTQFKQLAEPFLLLGDIENHIRFLIAKAFTVADLRQAKDPDDPDRVIADASDLTFGEYVRLLQNHGNWSKLNMGIDRATFTGWLDKVREVRNDIMHFDPDPIDPSDMQLLKDLARFLATWHDLTA